MQDNFYESETQKYYIKQTLNNIVIGLVLLLVMIVYLMFIGTTITNQLADIKKLIEDNKCKCEYCINNDAE